MDFDETKNKTAVDETKFKNAEVLENVEGFADLITEKTLLDFRRYIETTLKEIDENGTETYDPAVIVFSAGDVKEQPVQSGISAVEFSCDGRIYTGDDILPAENGIEMCMHAGVRAANDGIMPVAAFLVAEAWMAKYEENDARKILRPKDHPDKIEVLILSGMTITRKCTTLIYNIIREEDNRARLVLSEEMSDMAEASESGPTNAFFSSYLKTIMENRGISLGEEPNE